MRVWTKHLSIFEKGDENLDLAVLIMKSKQVPPNLTPEWYVTPTLISSGLWGSYQDWIDPDIWHKLQAIISPISMRPLLLQNLCGWFQGISSRPFHPKTMSTVEGSF